MSEYVLIRIKRVLEIIGISKSSLYREIRDRRLITLHDLLPSQQGFAMQHGQP